MTEREFGRLFVDFLINEKGFPKEGLLIEAPLADSDGRKRHIADLLILDTDFNNYLAIVEFKGGKNIDKRNALIQVKNYINVLGKAELPAYLVFPDIEAITGEFKIYLLDDNDWKEIKKEDFPHYETLKSKNQADEKREFKDFNDLKRIEAKKKKELVISTAWSTLTSLFIGIIVTFTLYQSTFVNDTKVLFSSPNLCCDSIELTRKEIYTRILNLETSLSKLNQSSVLDSVYKQNIELSKLDNRIIYLETILQQDPERILKIQEITFQIQELKNEIQHEKELRDNKLSDLKDRIEQLTIWGAGLIITIVGSIFGFAINAFRKN